MEKKEIYADGIGQIHFIGGMVRYDFVSLEPTGKTSGLQAIERIIMPPQGFLNMFNSMQELIDKLLAAGVLTKSEPQQNGAKIEDAIIIDDKSPVEPINVDFEKAEKPAKKPRAPRKPKQ